MKKATKKTPRATKAASRHAADILESKLKTSERLRADVHDNLLAAIRRAEAAENQLADARKMRGLAEDACRAYRITVEGTRIGLLHSMNVIETALARWPMTGKFGKPREDEE